MPLVLWSLKYWKRNTSINGGVIDLLYYFVAVYIIVFVNASYKEWPLSEEDEC
jgi:hypothetical protein